MTTCDCTTTSSVSELALRIERIDFSPALRNLLVSASQEIVSGVEPLAELAPPAVSLAIMLLDSWPYVAELLSLNDAAIATECYLSTSRWYPEPLAAVLGYRPRPATAPQETVVAHLMGGATSPRQVMSLRAASPELASSAAVESNPGTVASAALNELKGASGFRVE